MTVDQHSTFLQRAKLRIEDYMLLEEAGSLADYKKTELLDGEIFFVSAMFSRHAWAVKIMLRRIDDGLELIGSGLTALPGVSVSMPPHNLPQPDIVLTSEPIGQGYVPLASVALIVEVADSTVDDDLGRKARLYAEKEVPEYWVVDLPGAQLHQFWSPRSGRYCEERRIPLGEDVASEALEGLRVSTERVLPS